MIRAMFLLTGLGLVLLGQTKIPPIWPQIQGTFPHGGQRGTSVTVTLSGRNLQGAKEIVFGSGKLRGEIVKAEAYRVVAKISLAADTEPGRHDFRLLCGHGSAIGYFDVNTLAERSEKEPNDSREKAEGLVFPALVNGILKAGDYDYFRFEAKAGERLTFDVLATRNGANTDAVIGVLDAKGEELAYSDDYYGFKDPHVVFLAPKDGAYFLRVYGSSEAGSDVSDYRLVAGRMPHVDLTMPAGGRQGETVELELRGVNLDGVKRVTLGDGLAEGDVLRTSGSRARVRIVVPKGLRLGEHRLHVDGATMPVPFVVSQYREVDVSDGSARNRRDPKPVDLPVVANGVLDRAKATDFFVFRVEEAKTVVLDVEGMQLGYLTDPMVVLYDEAGKRLAYQDDPTTNTGKEPANLDPHLVFRLPKAGRYVAAVRDAQFRGDPSFLYRLTIKEAKPDFSVKVVGTDDTLYRGRDNVVLVRVRRLEGWTAPVEVWAENLPAGVTVQPVVAEPKNTPYTGTCGETHYLDGTNVEVSFRVAGDAPLALGQVRFMGRGVMDGETVVRTGKARYFRNRVRFIGDAEEEALRVTVADAPGVVLAVPETMRLDARGATKFTAIVTRLDAGKDALELTLEAAAEGLTLETKPVAVADTRAEVLVRATEKAPGEFVLVGRVGGVVIGRSHPIQIRRGGM
ncbi:MAG: pre-peptidase C-terminal domain-containing protein [Acidobacteria bacterium]|nr:pre-peptidase C-terminal domain-containing protein [Acidobacteriota bacterium]